MITASLGIVAGANSERLQELVDQEDIEGVLSVVSLDQIAEAWCRHTRGQLAKGAKGDEIDEPDWWAVDLLLTRRWWEDEARVRAGLLALVAASDTDVLLECVGAGPFETFLYGGEDQVRWIEEQAQRSEKFRKAISNMWVFGVLPDDVSLRIERAARTRLARPRGWDGP